MTKTVTGREYASIPGEDSGASFPRPSTPTAANDGSGLEKSREAAVSPPGKLGTLGAWLFEVLALLVSVASFAGIVALLVLYDEKPQPEFEYSLNINTFIAIFTTILRATLVFMVAGVIGQSKWRWITSPRPLRDIEVFDNAGRGAWGSLVFLFFSWKPIAAIMSAFVILTSYAVGPFSQQAVKTYTCEIPVDGAANILTAEWVGTADFNVAQFGVSAALLSPEMSIDMVNGLVQGVPNGNLALSQCKSSNCTFDATSGITHQSVGVCSVCVDVRDRIVERALSGIGAYDNATATAFRLGSGGGFGVDNSIEPTIFDMITEDTPDAAEHDLDFESGTVNTTVMSLTTNNCTAKLDAHGKESYRCVHDYSNMPQLGKGVDIVAAKCRLYPCVRKYHGSILNGVLNETLVSTEPIRRSLNMTAAGDNHGGYMTMVEPCLVRDKWYYSSNISQAPKAGVSWTSWTTRRGTQSAPSECVRKMEFEAFMAIENFLSTNFAGSCRAIHGTGSKQTSTVLEETRFLQCGPWWIQAVHKEGMASLGSISTAFDNVATAVSNRLRVVGENWSRTGGASVSGRGTQTTICVRVDWPWLLYPATLLVLSFGLLITACWGSFRDRETQPVWKSSILPLIFYDLAPKRKSPDGGLDGQKLGGRRLQLKELESRADKMVVQF
ncbi:hypothetical protein CPLU01_12495 [Colletotrichum plurivorum]|uniref:Uncharacterized protein n=1 Tax=Colletotrichum plurivorum TaxID=2175906 RepID=A0A8H6JXR0_9PEZI|nr:hypothetical protein CPLU01_12495 [Colletotrichum plurivorum]